MLRTDQLLGQRINCKEASGSFHDIDESECSPVNDGVSQGVPQDPSSGAIMSADVVFGKQANGHHPANRSPSTRAEEAYQTHELGDTPTSLPVEDQGGGIIQTVEPDRMQFRAVRAVPPAAGSDGIGQEECKEEAGEDKVSKEELQEFLGARFRLLAKQGKIATLESQTAEVSRLLASANISEVLQLSKPITFATANKIVRAVFLAVGLLLMYWFGAALYHRFHRPEREVRFLRFTALELRGGKSLSEHPGAHVREIGGLRLFCKVDGAILSEDTSLNRITAELREPALINGWYFVTDTEPDEFDPVKYTIQGSADGRHFFDLGTDLWRLNLDGSLYSVRDLNQYPPKERGERVKLSIVPWWPWLIRVFGKFLVPGGGLLGCSALANVRRGEKQKRVLVGALLTSAAMLLVAACAFAYISQIRNTFLDWTFSVVQGVLGLVLWQRERSFIPVMCFSCVIYPCAHFIEEALLTKFDDPQRKAYAILVGLLAVPVLAVFFLVRERQLRRKEMLLAPWSQQFAELWQQVSSSEEEALRGLQGLCRMLNASRLDRHTRRTVLVQRTHQEGALVSNLDQLYAQAAGAQFLLQRKMRAYARMCRGLIRATARATLSDAPPSYLSALVENENVVEWVQLKEPRRAVEKVLKVHGGDVSRLMDVCRGRIVFDGLADLIECVRLITHDTMVDIERVFNGLDLADDGRSSAGLRMVVMKLRLRSKEGRVLGVDNLVCELQLVLRQWDELVTLDFHRAFVEYSDALRLSETWDLSERLFGLCACRRRHRPGTTRTHSNPQETEDSNVSSGARLAARHQMLHGASTRTGRHPSLESTEGGVPLGDMTPPGAHPSWKSKTQGWASWKSWARRLSDGGDEGDKAAAMLSAEVSAVLGQAGSSLSSQRREALIAQYRISVELPSGHLDKRMKNANTAMTSAHSASVFHTSMPIAAALTKPWFRWVLVALAGLFCLQLVFHATIVILGRRAHPVALRFTSLELRDADLAANPGPHIAEVGLLLDGCRVELPAGHTSEVEGNSLQVRLPEAVTMNGWYLMTGQQPPAVDPVRFELHGLEEGESKMAVHGASDLFVSDAGEFRFSSKNKYDTPTERGRMEKFDYRVPWQYGFRLLSVNIIGIITLASAALCGVVGLQFLGKQLLVAGTFTAALCLVVVAGGFVAVQRYRESFPAWGLALGNAALSALLAFRETFIVQQTLTVGLFVVLAAILESTAISWAPAALLSPERSFPLTGLVLIATGLIVGWRRRSVLNESKAAVDDDMKQYNVAWGKVKEREEAALKRLGKVAELIMSQADGPQREGRLSMQDRVMSGAKRMSTALRPDSLMRRPSDSGTGRRPSSGSSHRRRRMSSSGSHVGAPSELSDQALPVVEVDKSVKGVGLTASVRRGLPGRDHDDGAGSQSESKEQEAGRDSEEALTLSIDVDAGSSKGLRLSGGESWQRAPSLVPESPPLGTTPGPKQRKRLSVEHVVLSISSLLSSSQSTELTLDALYAQAAVLHVELAAKVRTWALECGGLVAITPAATAPETGSNREQWSGLAAARHGMRRRSDAGAGGERDGERGKPQFVKLEEALSDSRLQRRMKLAKLKRPERAIEKLVRSYHKDVSKLTDICRNTLLFERVDDLTACLERIVRDPEVALGRVKNRLAFDYDPALSAGYRDVALNLCVTSPYTVSLGIDQHVCELQLILKDFAELKNAEGHKRYVELRNARGE